MTRCRLDWHGFKHLPVSHTNEFSRTKESPACDRWTTSYPYEDADGDQVVYYGLYEGHGKTIRDYSWCRYCRIALAPAAYFGDAEITQIHAFGDEGQISVRLLGGDDPVVVSMANCSIDPVPDPQRALDQASH